MDFIVLLYDILCQVIDLLVSSCVISGIMYSEGGHCCGITTSGPVYFVTMTGWSIIDTVDAIKSFLDQCFVSYFLFSSK